MALRCVYVDLDGTLLVGARHCSTDGEGKITTMCARIEACLRAT